MFIWAFFKDFHSQKKSVFRRSKHSAILVFSH
jgi:hypothetical protein